MRTVAEAFLDSVISYNSPTTAALLTKDMRAFVSGGTKEGDARFLDRIKDWEGNWISNVPDASYTLDAEASSAGPDEAIFRGTLTGKERKASIKVFVVKDKESGRYLVSAFTVK
jgi:hypothetical protein